MGKGYVCKCPACGHEEELITGLGWRGLLQVEQERENILAGEYGPKAQAILIAHPETLVDVGMAPYQCRACGKLESRTMIQVKAPVRVPIYQRCDCGAIMHRIRIGQKVICPACGKPMHQTDEMIHTLWD